MNRLIKILPFFLFCISATAQPYGNEWINYNQKYIKFKVTEDGVYKIEYPTLSAGLALIGENINSINPKNIQLFGRGQELYIHVEGEADDKFDPNDFIEFYAQRNDGWFDSLLYDSPESQNNPYFSLYNDTATYFITLNNQTSNKRLTNFTTPSSPTGSPSPYLLKEDVKYHTLAAGGGHWKGWYDSNGKHQVDYTAGEGWFYSAMTGLSVSQAYSFSLSDIYTGAGAPDALAEVCMAGVNNPATNPDHHLQVFYNSQTSPSYNNSFEAFALLKPTFSVPNSQLLSTTTIIVKHGTLSDPSAKSAVAYVKLKYPRGYNLAGYSKYSFSIPSNTADTYVQISGFSTGFPSYIYDFSGKNRIKTFQSGTTTKGVIPAGNEKSCYLFTTDQAKSITSLQATGAGGFFEKYLAADPDSAFIIISNSEFNNEVASYANYRSSAAGGTHNVLIADIDHLYDQFAYGIQKHPLSIRRFCDYLLDSLSTPPANLFLIGKSITYFNSRSGAAYQQNKVPTIGYPSTDNFFTAGLNGTIYEPAIPTGRLAAITAKDVDNYLTKVKGLENEQNTPSPNIADKDWMKHVIHFGGGTGVGQQNSFSAYLNSYEAIIEDTCFGGYVHEVFKNSSDVITNDLSETITGWINHGVSLITFFGHSTAQGFDVSLDDPEFYNNVNKYPMFIANGCQSGNIHNYVSLSGSASENFVLATNAGAIGFLASTDLGLEGPLHAYSTRMYKNIGQKNYGKSIGKCIKATIQDYQSSTSNSFELKAVCHEMSLHGDPSIVINPHEKPDYAIEPSSVFFTPEIVSTDAVTFNINVDITNIGKATNEPISVWIQRKFPDGTTSDHLEIISPIFYRDTFVLSLPVDQGSGQNEFKIWVDGIANADLVEEIYEPINNYLLSPSIPLWISSNEIIPIFPYNYAVVETSNITLKASTADIFAQERPYLLQLDTTDTYNSPLEQTTITQSGGVVSWSPAYFNDTIADSTVFFWRCTPASDLTKWKEHSFQYVNGKTGWGQDHFFQYTKDNKYQFFTPNRDTRTFSFQEYVANLSCRTVSNASNTAERYATEFKVNGEQIEFGVCYATPGIYIAVFDSVTFEPWGNFYVKVNGDTLNPDHKFGNSYDNYYGCGWSNPEPLNHFIFLQNTPNQLDSMIDMLLYDIPCGNYFLIYTAVRGDFINGLWDSSHFSDLESLGATLLSTGGVLNPGVANDSPYILLAKKCYPDSTKELLGKPDSTIFLQANMVSTAPYGYMESPVIGPSYEWKSLHYKHIADEPGNNDTVSLELYGIRINGTDTLLYVFNGNYKDINNLSSYVNASDYPYIRLKANIKDLPLQSSGQWHRWHVLYDGIPEAALNPANSFLFNTDTIEEGQDLIFSISIENVSLYDMDSLRVSYWLKDTYGNKIPVTYNKQAPLLNGTTLIDTVSYNTLGTLGGKNSFWIDVNPEDSLWQLEQYHFNNMAGKDFYLKRDQTNPLLDVTFDGIHILDGDIVSPKPAIVIELKDENKFIAMNDTSGFSIFITDPEGNETLVPFVSNGKEILIFTPAKLPENRARVEYNPTFEKDGIYILSVQGKDASGNNAGDFKYNISFEVINKSSITEIINYPNPFSTSTRFVFVLTGSQVPDQFKIQILTVSGKVIREITEDEIGPIHIGRNVSQYAWNGTDEFGDPVGNGVYVYRTIVKINGEDIEHRNSNADNFFKKGFGKMYLMR